MQGVCFGYLVVHAVEYILLIAFGVEHDELGRIQKPPGVQSADRDEVSPLRTSVTEIYRGGRCSKAAVGCCDTALGRGQALPRAGRHVDHHARLLSIFGRRRARDNLHGFDRIERDLVREDLALLVRNGLAIDHERVLRMITHPMKQPVRIRRNSRRGERHQRTDR